MIKRTLFNLLYLFIVVSFASCYKPPPEMEDLSEVTPPGWSRYKWNTIINDYSSYYGFDIRDYVFINETNIYLYSWDYEIYSFNFDTTIKLYKDLNEYSSTEFDNLLLKSDGSFYLWDYHDIARFNGSSINIFEPYYIDEWGWEDNLSYYYSIILDKDDKYWLIYYSHIYKQISTGSDLTEELYLSLIPPGVDPSGYEDDPKTLFNIKNEIWILNDENDLFEYINDSTVSYIDVPNLSSTIDDIRVCNNNIYLITDYTIYEQKDNSNNWSEITVPDGVGYLKDLSCDNDGNLLLYLSNGCGRLSVDVWESFGYYCEDDYGRIFCDNNNRLTIFGEKAMYIYDPNK